MDRSRISPNVLPSSLIIRGFGNSKSGYEVRI